MITMKYINDELWNLFIFPVFLIHTIIASKKLVKQGVEYKSEEYKKLKEQRIKELEKFYMMTE